MTDTPAAPATPDPLLRLPCHCDNDGWYVHDPDCLRGIAWEARAEARSTPAEALDVARRAIEAEIAMASDPDGKDQFEKGALAAYHFALSVLSPSPESDR